MGETIGEATQRAARDKRGKNKIRTETDGQEDQKVWVLCAREHRRGRHWGLHATSLLRLTKYLLYLWVHFYQKKKPFLSSTAKSWSAKNSRESCCRGDDGDVGPEVTDND